MSAINAELSMNPNMERAREEAARAFHSTLLSEGVIIQTNALDAAIEAFLAAARADEWLVERVAGLIHDICSPDYPWKTFASLNPELADRRRNAARAAIAALTTAPAEASQPSGK